MEASSHRHRLQCSTSVSIQQQTRIELSSLNAQTLSMATTINAFTHKTHHTDVQRTHSVNYILCYFHSINIEWCTVDAASKAYRTRSHKRMAETGTMNYHYPITSLTNEIISATMATASGLKAKLFHDDDDDNDNISLSIARCPIAMHKQKQSHIIFFFRHIQLVMVSWRGLPRICPQMINEMKGEEEKKDGEHIAFHHV